MPTYDRVWTNARLVTMVAGDDPYGMIEDGVLATCDGAIAWIGAYADARELLANARDVVDLEGRCVTPGLIDAHTHLVYGGDRLADFERRLAGESYGAAAVGGGGIAHTVALTRAATADDLFASALERLRTLNRHGATTVEIKSGYGLDVETELRMLAVARRLGEATGVSVRTTYLGAHLVPPDYAADRAAYVDLVCDVMLPRVAREGLADAVDIFCESIAFTAAETRRVISAARRCALPLKLHVDQLTDGGGAALAAQAHALSADHLEYTSDAGVAALAAAGTVAIVLPGAYYYLSEPRKPPIAALRAHGVPIALATDCNPGTSPITSLPIAMNLACVLFGLSPVEALRATTVHAAQALGLRDRGILRVGLRTDLAIWDVTSPAEIAYLLGADICAGTVSGGESVRE